MLPVAMMVLLRKYSANGTLLEQLDIVLQRRLRREIGHARGCSDGRVVRLASPGVIDAMKIHRNGASE